MVLLRSKVKPRKGGQGKQPSMFIRGDRRGSYLCVCVCVRREQLETLVIIRGGEMSPYLMVLYALANVAIVFSPPVLPGYRSQQRFIRLVKSHWKIQDCDQVLHT